MIIQICQQLSSGLATIFDFLACWMGNKSISAVPVVGMTANSSQSLSLGFYFADPQSLRAGIDSGHKYMQYNSKCKMYCTLNNYETYKVEITITITIIVYYNHKH